MAKFESDRSLRAETVRIELTEVMTAPLAVLKTAALDQFGHVSTSTPDTTNITKGHSLKKGCPFRHWKGLYASNKIMQDVCYVELMCMQDDDFMYLST